VKWSSLAEMRHGDFNERKETMYPMENLHRIIMEIYDFLISKDLTLTEASYALQIINQELIEQGYSPKFRELKEKRQNVIDSQWTAWESRRQELNNERKER
jgi:hypothetical protein